MVGQSEKRWGKGGRELQIRIKGSPGKKRNMIRDRKKLKLWEWETLQDEDEVRRSQVIDWRKNQRPGAICLEGLKNRTSAESKMAKSGQPTLPARHIKNAGGGGSSVEETKEWGRHYKNRRTCPGGGVCAEQHCLRKRGVDKKGNVGKKKTGSNAGGDWAGAASIEQRKGADKKEPRHTSTTNKMNSKRERG